MPELKRLGGEGEVAGESPQRTTRMVEPRDAVVGVLLRLARDGADLLTSPARGTLFARTGPVKAVLRGARAPIAR